MAISISPILSPSSYSPADETLLNKTLIETSFNPDVNYIEYVITDVFNSFTLVDYSYNRYSFPTNGTVTSNNISSIDLDPVSDIRSKNLNVGDYIVYYNFYQNELLTSFSNKDLFIKDISSDRTELIVRYNSPYVDPSLVVNNFNNSRTNNFYFQDFYLNFGDNNLVVANNITVNSDNKEILINLYEALPFNINVNSSFWVVTKIADALGFDISITPDPFTPTVTSVGIKGPNFNLPIKDQTNNTTGYLDYTTLLQIQSVSSSNQMKSLLAEKGIDINIDYTDFSNFIHFSSAYQRLINFYYKVQQIENLNNQITSLSSVSNSTITINILQTQTTDIIENFDNYEYYLYYSSGSWAWPKSTSTLPYTLYSTGSSEVINWLGNANNLTGILGSASIYDENNQNSLYYSIPEYIRDDERNEPYYLFIEMVGQHYDSIWTYYKDVTNLYIADNRLDHGISKDLVAEALKSFGTKIYQNNYTTNDLYSAFLGYTTNNSETTGSLPVTANSGQEYISNYITASYDASVTPLDDYNKEIYKRLYHNLPYLAKTRGTIPGLRALINCFGVPDTILRISEFGGRDKDTSTYDYFNQQYNYAYYRTGSGTNRVATSFSLNPNWGAIYRRPESIQFRFKPDININSQTTQSLMWLDDVSKTSYSSSVLTLEYTGSGYTSASYSGSSYSSSYAYANLIFYPDPNDYTISASVYLPFFNGDWWSLQLDRVSGSINDTFTLYAGSKGYYDGYDGNQILHIASSSVNVATTNTPWNGGIQTAGTITLGSFGGGSNGGTINNKNYIRFTGLFQELRYWAKTGSIESFKDFIMNPRSIDYEGEENEYANYLAFRAPLGSELETLIVSNTNQSFHPKVTGSWVTTSSFQSNSNYTIYNSIITSSNIESYFYDQPIAGIKNRVTDKIQIVSSSYPTGSVLSQYRSLEQTYPTLGSETPDINLLEVAFSPQNEVNDDIISSLGYFNIGEYIGDPRQISSSATTYPDLVNLSNNFFQKYFASYDLFDYIRLIKYFDNSLFKMIQDFVPARTSLTSGVVIKQHLLERNKYPQPQVEWEFEDYSGSIQTAFIEGGTGGTFDSYNFTGSTIPPTFINNTQSWGEEVKTPVGLLTISHSTQDEFYNGELPNSLIITTDGELNETNTIKYPSDTAIIYNPTLYLSNITNESTFTNPLTSPNPGEAFLWWDSGSLINPGNTRYIKPTRLQVSSLGRTAADFLVNKTNGVKYIKLNRIDSGGLDQSPYLQQLQTIRLSYPDRSDVTYNIAGVQNFGDYFLYSIGPYAPGSMNNFNTSSVGDIKNYTLQTNQSSFNESPGAFIYTASLTSTSDPLGYFNNTTHIYTLENTPNIALRFEITASSVATTPPGGQAYLYLLSNTNIPGSSISQTVTMGAVDYNYIVHSFSVNHGSSGNTSIILSGSKTLLESSSFIIGANGGLTVPISIGTINFNITPLTPEFNGSSSLTIFDPYVSNFDYNEYNALINNAEIPQTSVFFMDVDYSQNPVIPVNQSLILDESADRAYVQDSNYTSQAWSNIRYNGSRTNSYRIISQ
jgi:hypothetical protein